MFTAALLAGAVLSSGSAFAAATATGFVRLTGNPPAAEDLAAAGATSALAPASSLSMRVVMALRNQAELTQRLADLQDPSSPEYHQWLTSDEFTARFGPTPEDLSQVSAWLTQEGFTVTSASAADRMVRFTGSAAQASSAFQTSFAATPDGHHFASMARPAVPASLAGRIQSIMGLDNLHGFGVTPQPEVTLKGGSKKHAFGPQDMYAFYDESPLLDATPSVDGSGADCTALPEYSDFDDASVAVFNGDFDLPVLSDGSTLVRVDVDGPASIIPGDEFEALLDVEYSHAAAPGTPIRVYIAAGDDDATTGFLDTVQQAVTDNDCGTISLSIFVCFGDSSDAASFATSADGIYQQAAAQGQTVFAAAGDDGAAGPTFNTKKNACVAAKKASVIETSASPNVISVGGTQSTPKYAKATGIATGHATESVWHEGIGATGGGKSAVFPKPAYQDSVTPNDNARDIPDISLLAAAKTPGYVVIDLSECSGVCLSGGTSFASPYWAGIAALMEQLKGGGLDGRLGPFNTQLYSLASSNAAASGILDVTKGNNGFNGVKGFTAKPGYDQATGWGTPDINTFAHAFTGD